MIIHEYRGYDQKRVNELARVLSLPPEERRAYYEGKERQKEMEEREREVNLAIDRLLEMGLPITSVKRGVVIIDFNQAVLP